MTFYIPSYLRAGSCTTVRYLLSNGIKGADITISTQTEKDFASYRKIYGGICNVTYRAGSNVAMNRNTCILDAQKRGIEKFIMMDDDYDCVMSFVPKRNTRIEGVLFKEFVAGVEKLLEQGVSLIGLYPISNNMFALGQKPITRNILTGPFMAFSRNDFLFDEEYRVKEDYELCLRMMQRGHIVARLNRYFAKVTLHKDGGCHADFEAGCSEEFSKRLLMIYPDLLKNGCRKGEIQLR